MAYIITGSADLKYDSLSVIPLGGQSELGQLLWLFTYGGEILIVDAGVAYPAEDLPGVDLLLPNTNFLEANQERILALLLTNGHEEHSGAVSYLLHHIKVPRIMAPRFVSALLSQMLLTKAGSANSTKLPEIDTTEWRYPYQIGPFEVEWIKVNDAIADASALRIGTPEGDVIYTSSFKLDQTPVDRRLLDVGRLAQAGDSGVLLLVSDSAGVENHGYTPSERAASTALKKHIKSADGRVIVVVPGTNTHRLQILCDLAKQSSRKVVLVGETLVHTALAGAITGNLTYERSIEAGLEDLKRLPDREVLVIATGLEGDPMDVLSELAFGRNKDISVKEGDLIIYSADIFPGRARQMASFLDQFLSLGVRVIYGPKEGVHVSKHASREELKLMLSLTKPKYFIPAIGEGRHIMHHAQLAEDWGVPMANVFPLKNGEILEVDNGVASIIGSIEAQAVLFNRDQGERVTTFSVNERRALSLEGVVTLGLVINDRGELIAGPSVEAGASGFLRSKEWEDTKEELRGAVLEVVSRLRQEAPPLDIAQMKSQIRDTATKTLRARLQAKPAVQVVIHELVRGTK
ncbi:MAG TPA: ribonuclease J [Candidatus Obscuribacterales bacterium]